MPSEILSTARPTSLRLAGFLVLVVGAAAAAVGATLEWAIVGFPLDFQGAADVPVHGSDEWEGKVVLFGAVVALLALVALRLARSGAGRRGVAILLIGIGATSVLLPLVFAARAGDRFGGREGVDTMAETLAADLGLPEDVVRGLLTEQFERQLRMDLRPGLWLSAAGGLLLVVGGVLGLAWVRQRDSIRDA